MFNSLLIFFGKTVSKLVKILNLGHGSTLPGHIALKLNKNFIRDLLKKSHTKTIIVAGTNGKTTTSKLIAHILEKNSKRILQNESGANLLNGIASSLLLHSSMLSTLNYDYAIFEVDENALPQVLKEIMPDYLILLNLFRDQLDRYGEVNTIATKWLEAIATLPEKTTLILNADDPQIAYLGEKTNNKLFFGLALNPRGLKLKNQTQATDSTYCPQCGNKLTFTSVTFSHLGNWQCTKCGLQHPTPDLTDSPYYPLSGTYNQYNTNAAVLAAKTLGLSDSALPGTGLYLALQHFKPAFGRQEELEIDGKHVCIFLSKNPTGFNESLRTIKELGGKNILFVLNDRIPDGRDVSWIWDTDLEGILDDTENITISGDRAYDMGLRIKYASRIENGDLRMEKHRTYESLRVAINTGLETLTKNETLYILPTYTAMLEARKILTGKKIL